MISDALANKIVDGIFSQQTAATVAALLAFGMAILNRYKSAAQHQEQAVHLTQQDEKLEVIRGDVNNNMTVATNKLTRATDKLEVANDKLIVLAASAGKNEGIIEAQTTAKAAALLPKQEG